MKIVALATCHNRRDLTLRALKALQRQIIRPGCRLDICLVDDGSSDGTGESVRASYPSVTILDGPGDLFWAGGMRFGWKNYAVAQEPDYLLVFNDDIEISQGALETLLSVADRLESDGCASYAVSGALRNPETGETAYGGAIRNSWWHPLRFRTLEPTDTAQECDTVNMNITLISRAGLKLIGFLAPDFAHARADFDFGLRMRSAGGRVVLAPGFLGECHVNPLSGTSGQMNLSFVDRWRRLTGVKEQPPGERATYYRKHGGLLWPLHWALPYVRVCIESAFNFLRKSLTGGRGT